MPTSPTLAGCPLLFVSVCPAELAICQDAWVMYVLLGLDTHSRSVCQFIQVAAAVAAKQRYADHKDFGSLSSAIPLTNPLTCPGFAVSNSTADLVQQASAAWIADAISPAVISMSGTGVAALRPLTAARTAGRVRPVPNKYAFQAINNQTKTNRRTSPLRKAPAFAAGLNKQHKRLKIK